MASTKRIPRLRFAIGCGVGMGDHRVRARIRASIGVKRKRI